MLSENEERIPYGILFYFKRILNYYLFTKIAKQKI